LVVGLVSLLSQFTVVGLSCFFGVTLNGLSAMASLMSTGFAVEYSVHVVHRFMTVRCLGGTSGVALALAFALFLELCICFVYVLYCFLRSISHLPPRPAFRCQAPGETPLARVLLVMEQLVLPTSLSFFSSAVGIVVLLASPFQFVRVNFFVPLFVMLFATYFYGVFLLPVLCCAPTFAAAGSSSRSSLSKVSPDDDAAAEPARQDTSRSSGESSSTKASTEDAATVSKLAARMHIMPSPMEATGTVGVVGELDQRRSALL
jgi:hypothetical protein